MGPARKRWNGPKVEPTSLTEITRRYVATAVALAKAMGLPLTEDFMREHRESISCCFIEAGRAGVRLPPAVQLPPLPQANGVLNSELSADAHPVEPVSPLKSDVSDPDTPEAGELEPPTNGHTPPLVIPKDAGVPCGGVVIGDLKPAQLAMLVSKTAALVHAEGEAWMPLLGALQAERASRLARGQRRPVTPVSAPGPDGPPPAIVVASGPVLS